MNKNQSAKTFLLVLLYTLLFTAAGTAQEKESKSCGNSCCDGKTQMMHKSDMDHSKMDHSMMKETMDSTKSETSELTAKEVDSKLVAWNAVCPVRGEEIDPEANKIEYSGKVYGFCCNGCDTKFMKDPEKFSKNLSEDGKSFVGTK
jgi:YHS domain-containing protein